MKKGFLLIAICTLGLNISCGNNDQKNKDLQSESKSQEIMDTISTRSIPADTYSTEKGDLNVTLVGHGSLMFEFDGKTIHVDPYSKVADYSLLPKADLIILTHEHSDHLDTLAINKIKKADTRVVLTKACNDSLKYGEVISNGEKTDFNGIQIQAVPAYNIVNKRPDGEVYHPKGRGNGYVFTFADKKVYVAGDTENIPEMTDLKDKIYIAFLPKNLPYTMTDDMFVDAVKTINPTYLYPYHFAEYNDSSINKLLGESKVEILLRPMSNQ